MIDVRSLVGAAARLALTLLLFALAGWLIGWSAGHLLVLRGIVDKFPWYLSRAAAITAYVLLSGATVLGLSLSTRLLDRWLGRDRAFALHEHLSWLALAATALHGGALLFDRYEPFPLTGILIPFVATYRPAAVALGIVAAYLIGVVVASFYVRARLGRRVWRALHWSTFGLYAFATLHGLLAGSSSGQPWMQALYLASSTLVLFLTNYRLLLGPRAGGRPAEVARTRAAAR